jgi:mannose-6-phosphate isomerase
MTVLALDGVARDYAWGSHTAIQRLLGVPSHGPIAELWFGDHPGDPARVPSLGTTLDAVIAADPAGLLGAAVVDEYGPHLPFLLKILAADRALSIQVHPTRAQAAAGYAAHDPNYTDANHKPELICALTPFEALCGFRPVHESAALFDAVGLPTIATLLRGPDGLRAAFLGIVEHGEPDVLAELIATRATHLPDGAARAATLAAHDFPGDVGVAVTMLLNYVRLAPGEAIFLGAGNVHCYLRGVGVEIMAASDNVLRCGLTPKRIDVAELLEITDFSSLTDPRWPDHGGTFSVPVPDFRLATSIDAAGDGPRIVLCVDGAVTVADVPVGQAHAAFVPAGEQVTITGDGHYYVATVGTPSPS